MAILHKKQGLLYDKRFFSGSFFDIVFMYHGPPSTLPLPQRHGFRVAQIDNRCRRQINCGCKNEMCYHIDRLESVFVMVNNRVSSGDEFNLQ